MTAPACWEAAMAAALLDPARPVPASAPGAERRFAVHRNNVVAGLVDALGAAYPAIRSLVGEPFFRAAAAEFVRTNPPRSPVLHEYGGEFPDFIAAFPPAARVPYLGDVARLERAWLAAYHAADVEPVAIDVLGRIDSGDLPCLTFAMHPSLAVIASPYPTVSLWSATTGRMPAEDIDLGTPEIALVARPRASVDVVAISDDTAEFCTGLLAGAPLGSIARSASRAAPFDLAVELARVFASGWVVGLRPAALS
jgi:hypothetical protein